MTFVCVEMDGSSRMYGVGYGLNLATGDSGSGTAAGDRSGYMMTFNSNEKEDFLIVPSNIVAALETPGT